VSESRMTKAERREMERLRALVAEQEAQIARLQAQTIPRLHRLAALEVALAEIGETVRWAQGRQEVLP
jgi:hypothetical protein